jgi:hypothetical protein
LFLPLQFQDGSRATSSELQFLNFLDEWSAGHHVADQFQISQLVLHWKSPRMLLQKVETVSLA